MDQTYPEIGALNQLWVKYKVETKIDSSEILDGKKYYSKVNFKIGGEPFSLFIDDEYEDLRYNYPLLNFCLILRELEGFKEAYDYNVWCQERYLDVANPQVKTNYKNLGSVYKAVEQIMGTIESKITDWDFEMNAGAAQRLRKIDI